MFLLYTTHMKRIMCIFCIALCLWALLSKGDTPAYGKPTSRYTETRYETGISTSFSLLGMSDDDLDRRLRDIKSLGVTWIRVDLSWNSIQPDGPEEYKWKEYDRLVEAAEDHELKILALLGYTPAWAREPRCKALIKNEKRAQKCNPRSSVEFGNFARTAAERYGHKSIRGWEIWNEPNLLAYWKTAQANGNFSADPAAYANLANAAARQIRQQTDGVIITGGLSPLFEPSRSTGMRQSDYLARLLPLLDYRLFDAIGIHPYTWPILPSRAEVFNAFYTVDNGPPEYNLRTIMSNAGWSEKQIWATEYGASTHGARLRPNKRARADHVTEDIQAQIVAEGMNEWYNKSNVGPLFVHSDSDQWLHPGKNEKGFGLRRSDGTPKPAYDAFKKASQEIPRSSN